MKTRLLGVISSFMLIFYVFNPIISVEVKAASNIKINNVDIGYAPGDYFSTTGSACKCHNTDSCVPQKSNCTCIHVNGTAQCYAFALWCQNKLFGKNDVANPGDFNNIGSIAVGSVTASSIKNLLYGKAVPGSHIRTKGSQHSMAIVSIDANGFTVAQANGSNNKEYSTWSACRIGTSTYTWDSYASSTYGKRGIEFVKVPKNASPIINPNPINVTVDSSYATPWEGEPKATSGLVTVYNQYGVAYAHTERNIAHNDWCTIHEVYTSGYCKVTYPISGGTHTEYARVEDFDIKKSNAPILCVDVARGEAGKIVISGWAYDKDNPSKSLDIHVYIDDNEWVGGTVCQYEDDDGLKKIIGPASSYLHRFIATFQTTKRGAHNLKIAALDDAGGNATWSLHDISIPKDTTPPKITKVWFSNINKDKFRVEIDVSDNIGLKEVKVPSWSHEAPDGNWQDDLVWHKAVKYTDTHWYCDVYVKDHKNNYGKYAVDIYAYDEDGNVDEWRGENKKRQTASIGIFKLTYNPNGGKANGSTAVQSPKSTDPQLTYNGTNYYSLTWTKPSRSGYTFKGWFDAKSGGKQIYGADGKCVNEGVYWKNNAYVKWGDMVVYAQWKANTYKLSYNANMSGITNPASKTVTFDAEYGTLPTLKKDGYVFEGWYTAASGGTKITSTSIVKTASDHTLYAHWAKKKYKVTFDSNGGNAVSPASKEVTYNGTYGTLPAPTKTGHTFLGWYTAKTGGTKITAETKVTITANQTLYAQWTAKKYKVTFDSNGGNAVNPTSKEVTYNGTYGTLPTPIKQNHKFLGWYTAKTGGTKITAETKVTITTNQTLYAQWSINKYKVTFDATGGVCTPVSKDVVSGNVYNTLPAPTRQDYTFLGWYTSKTGGTKITSETKVTITANQNLYARWTPSKPSWDAYDFKGAGTADDPYQISRADELKELSKLVNNAYYNKVYGSAYYIQTKDIDLDNEEWIPIGYASESDKTTYNGDRLFKGFYDGQFHSVLNLNITDKFKYTGLFGRLSEGKIQNLKVEGKVNTTNNFVGGICGEITSNGIVEKCSFSGSVSGNKYIGGIAGKIYVSGTVKNSNALADVNGLDYGVGGCVGIVEIGGSIENVYHIGVVKNNASSSTGGILGRSMISTTQPNDNIIIQNAYHIGEVTAPVGTENITGEIVGYAEDKDYTFILNCYCAKDANPGFNGSVAKADIQEISLNLIRFIAEDLGKPFVTNTNEDNNNGYPVFEWQIDEQAPVEPETVHGSGDVNNDGKTDLTDLTYLSLYLLGDVDFTQQQLKTIDINKDNKVDIADLPTLKMVIMKS